VLRFEAGGVYLFFFILWGGTKSLGTAATSGLLYKPQMIDEGDCGAIGGKKIARGNRSTWRKPAPASLCPPQIPHDQTPGSNPGRRGGKPATNRLSYGADGMYLTIRCWRCELRIGIRRSDFGTIAERNKQDYAKCFSFECSFPEVVSLPKNYTLLRPVFKSPLSSVTCKSWVFRPCIIESGTLYITQTRGVQNGPQDQA
jgi:hypothetical protein